MMTLIFLWLADFQLLAAALLVGALLAIACLRQPARRLAVAKATLAALAVLAILCALPGWSLVHLLREPPAEAIARVLSEPASPAASAGFSAPIPAERDPIAPPIDPAVGRPPLAPAPAAPIDWIAIAVVTYAAGCAATTLWLIAGGLLARRVRREATPAPPEFQALLQQLCGQEKPTPQLLISPRITAPVALGLRRPAILLPPPLQGGARGGISDASLPHNATAPTVLPPLQLLPILAHELAHLQHRDLPTLAATRLLLILLWPQPLYWLLRRAIRLDQETLADAAAADRAGRLDYAEQLLAWARTAGTQRPPRLAGAVGLWEGPWQLKRRIDLLLNEQFRVMRSCSALWRGGTLAALAILALGLSAVTLQPANSAAEQASDKKAADSAPADANPASGTTHQSVGMGTWKAVPIEPAKHQPNVLELHIVDENEQPLAGVEATLYSAASGTGDAKPIKTLASDDAGNVVFAAVVSVDQIAKFEKMKAAGEFIAVSPESYLVALKRPGLATALTYQSAGELALAGGKRTIMLRPAVKLSGRVTDPEGKPVPNAVVTAGSWAGARNIDGVNTATTDADGRYEFTDRAPFNRAAARQGSNAISFAALAAKPPASQKGPSAPEDPAAAEVSTLVVTHPDFAVTRIEGGDVPGVANVQMLPAASIIGRVVHHETGAPVAGVTVLAMAEPTYTPQAERDGDAIYTPIPHSHSATTQTDEQGVYRLANLPAGTYNLWLIEENAQKDGTKLAARGLTGIAAVAGAEPTLAPDTAVGPPPSVTVQLIDAATGKPLPIGRELVAIPMALRADHPRLPPPPHQRVPIAQDGTFKFVALPGKFRIGVEVVEKPGTLYQVHYRPSDDFHNSASVVDLDFGDHATVEVLVYPVAQLEQFRSEQSNAYKLVEAKEFDEAIAAFSKMIAARPQAHAPLSGRGYVYRLAGRYGDAIADAEALLKLFPDDAQSKFVLADLLASSPIEGTRDGKRALQYAQELVAAAQISHRDSDSIARYLEFAAAAHAELGDFAKAVAVQQEAIAQAATMSTDGMESRLKLYRSNKPYRRELPVVPASDAPANKPADQGATTGPNPRTPFWTIPASTDVKLTVTGVPAAEADGKASDADVAESTTWQLLPEPALNVSNPTTLQDAVR
jgi:beta-lactamase regulating signal transducer with metallopeptidase domain/tetratricopeptide (TPR) repeat protein